MTPAAHQTRTWTRRIQDHRDKDVSVYTVSTDASLIDLDALGAALASDMAYWAKPMPREALRVCVKQSLCFGLFVREEGDCEDTYPITNTTAQPPGAMIGLARLITDYTTFAYLTDVYVLPAHRGRRLGEWLMGCVGEELAAWPALRRCLLLTRGEAATRLYARALGPRRAGELDGGLVIMERCGPGVVDFQAGGGREGSGHGD